MGVADNKTYKDMYHFNSNFYGKLDLDEVPSLNVDPKINTTIKENPSSRTNVEIEKNEIVLQPDLSALFKARGKKHKNGGINVNLRPNSFVFSNDKSMNIPENIQKIFEFKEGGKTPSEVLRKNIDLKHYNTMITNISDLKKDDLAKKSSAMMLEKYIGTLGNIAFIQESKKNFPDGLPDFAQNTAPVYNPELKDNIMQQKQYAKYGGNIKAQMGVYYALRANKGRDPQVVRLDYLRKMASRQALGNEVDDPNIDYDKLYTQTLQKLSREAVNEGAIPDNKQGPLSGVPALDNKLSGVIPLAEKITYTPKTPDKITPRPGQTPDKIAPGEVTGAAERKKIDWQFSPWQKVSQAWNAAKYASLRRYDPMRSRFNPSYVDPYLVNPEQVIGDLKGAAYQGTKSLGTLNPILRNAQAAGIQGQLMNQIPGVRSQYDNQNAGIIGQTRQVNNQIANTAMGQNMQNDQNYYQQTVVGRQNFDNMKSYLGDQWMNNILGDVTTNQTLAYNLASQKNPAWGYDFRRGDFYRLPKDLRDVASNGKSDMLAEYANKMLGEWDTLDPKTRVDLLKVLSLKGFTPTNAKKGAYLRPKYK